MPQRELFLDIETYSRVNLKDSNAYRYVEDDEFQILMCAYALGDDPVQLALGEEEIFAIPGLWDPDVLKVAHSAAFERVCFSAMAWARRELPRGTYLSPKEYDCSAALAGVLGYPQKLENLGAALDGEKKDTAGTRLISLFCKPNRKGERNLPEDYPQEWEDFGRYCIQDVVTHRSAYRQMGGWPVKAEREAYLADQVINDTGIAVDRELAEAAVEVADNNRMVQELEISSLTGVQNPGSNAQLQAWLQESGLRVPNMQADTITSLLARPDLTPTQRRVLQLRQELALVAAKKYVRATKSLSSDGRLRGQFQFFGAHTGRWSGRGVQIQNLPSATLRPEEGGDVDAFIAAHVLDVKMGLGANAHTLKALVRAMFTGPFTVVDYAAIEARVVAWLAGEQWALDAFAEGRDIYVETAERMGGLTRKEGKVAVLALGYNGGIKSLRAMGAEGDDDKLQRLVYQWRDANENIVALWADLQSAFRVGGRAGRLRVERDGRDRYLVLPSGRSIAYRDVRERWATNQWSRRVRQLSFSSPQTYPARMDTYGGRLTENVTQAVARDILSEALVRLLQAGHRVVGHIHDEILVEGESSVEEVTRLMVQPPTWSTGLPLSAEGFVCPRYRKD